MRITIVERSGEKGGRAVSITRKEMNLRVFQGRPLPHVFFHPRLVLGISDELPEGGGVESFERMRWVAEWSRKQRIVSV